MTTSHGRASSPSPAERPPAAGKERGAPSRSRVRLVRALPEVLLGADALAGLDGRRGFLYGEKRHRQVDVLGFEPAVGKEPTVEAVVDLRLDRAEIAGWRVVGVAVRLPDLEAGEDLLLEGLVAGDVVIAGPRAERVLVHRGDCLSGVRAAGRRRGAPAR